MTQRKLPDCYDCRIFFQPKDGERKYIKQLCDIPDEQNAMLAYTTDVAEAKLFRPHVGWAGPGTDWDAYHNAMKFMRTFFTMDGHYRTAVGSENFDDTIDHTLFVCETLEGSPRLTFVLIPTRSKETA
ncbi:hypothetical protein D3C78_428000 [compost metagenome]